MLPANDVHILIVALAVLAVSASGHRLLGEMIKLTSNAYTWKIVVVLCTFAIILAMLTAAEMDQLKRALAHDRGPTRTVMQLSAGLGYEYFARQRGLHGGTIPSIHRMGWIRCLAGSFVNDIGATGLQLVVKYCRPQATCRSSLAPCAA
jgi:hypothetical protein